MNLGSLVSPAGSRKKRKRLGRGEGSGHGGTSTRGHKGQKARSGGKVRRGFEGGQMPLTRRLPKRGFTNFTRKEYAVINVGDLSSLVRESVVDEKFLLENGFLKERKDGLKILGGGEMSVPLTVRAKRFSRAAEQKIKKAGGKCEVVP